MPREINVQQIGNIVTKIMNGKTGDELKEIFEHGEEIYDEAKAAAEIAVVMVCRIFFANEIEEGSLIARTLTEPTEFDKVVAECIREFQGITG